MGSARAIPEEMQHDDGSTSDMEDNGADACVGVASLAYHDVVAAAPRTWNRFSGWGGDTYNLDEQEFRRHLRVFRETLGQAPATVDEVLRGAAGQSPWLLTFDDGCRSAATTVASCLAELGWRAHFFIPTRWIGWKNIVSEEQIRTLRASGHVIGTHSVSHPFPMTGCSRDRLVVEWRDSCAFLADILDEPILCGSIPGGTYSTRVAAAAAECGLRALFTGEPTRHVWKIGDCQLFGRYCYRRGMTAETMAALAKGHVWPRIWAALTWNSKKLVKWIGGPLFYRLHGYLLRHQGRR